MNTNSPVSLESIKLRLIQGQGNPASSVILNKEGIQYLIKSLLYADTAFSAEIEDVLVKAGAVAVPQLIKGLHMGHINVRSICAMALIRLGKQAEKHLLEAYSRVSASNSSAQWVYHFIFEEMGLDIAAPAQAPAKVPPVYETAAAR